ncbi:hypothetical protein BH24ACT3_BH24ACT3_17660 [soil metagenome]
MANDGDPTDDKVSETTRDEEQREATIPSDAGRGPTEEEEAAADRSAPASEEVKENYEDFLEKGADVKGEGEVP